MRISYIVFGTVVQFLLFSSAFAYSPNDTARTITSDGSLGDTQAAVNYTVAKRQDGWVLTVGQPGGAYTWGSNLTISSSNQLTIQGASPVNRPTITITVSTGAAIGLKCGDRATLVFKDVIFNEWPDVSLFFIGGSGDDCFRLTNLKFLHTKGIPVATIGSLEPTSAGKGPYGLIDHCEITGSGSGYGFFVRENQQPEAGPIPGSWMRPMTFGTSQAVYIEDCSFTSTSFTPGRTAFDGDNGGRIVFRHNTLINQAVGTHGADSPGPINSVLQTEVMHNNFTFGNQLAVDYVFFLRGGTAVVFDNNVVGGTGSEIHCITKMLFYRAFSGLGTSNVTLDRKYPADYVGTQQPGSGVLTVKGGDPHYPDRPWGSVPVYSWANHVNGPEAYGDVQSDGSGFEQLGRDYFIDQAKPGYTEYAYPHPLQAAVVKASLSPPSGLTVSTSGP